MDDHARTDGGTVVDPADRVAVRRNLERFAGASAVEATEEGDLRATFGGRTQVTVTADGGVEAGMPLHAFHGPADRLEFDHEGGELRVTHALGPDGTTTYVFRRP
ncbi:hypothetical protein ACFQGE_15985 [Halomicroarcula sp. GCM10025817]|uniref:hypothetical protein n=1 Tax=Haloarcula TaxID=2237 RepID=UPI0023E8DB7E|nr:hypothetical protein [Halomicroarcula sp. SYNS111]